VENITANVVTRKGAPFNKDCATGNIPGREPEKYDDADRIDSLAVPHQTYSWLIDFSTWKRRYGACG
jgi:hypothetical protein